MKPAAQDEKNPPSQAGLLNRDAATRRASRGHAIDGSSKTRHKRGNVIAARYPDRVAASRLG
jgi:hypothetical protein